MKALTTLVALTLLSMPIAAQNERIEVPLSNPGQPVTLDVEAAYGSVTIETHAENDHVLVEVRPRPMTEVKKPEKPRSDGLRRIADQSIGFEIEEEANHIEIDTEGHQAKRGVDLVIHTPERTSVEVSGHRGGDVHIRGVRGNHEIGHHAGSIEALGISGSLVAETHNGSITVELLSVDAGAPMAFSTWNGTIDTSFPGNLAANIVMQTENGEILTAFDVNLDATRPRIERKDEGGGFRLEQERETRGSIGGGGAEIRFETYNGDIIVRKTGG